MLTLMGLEHRRFQMVWCSSAEAERFAAAAREFTQELKDLGPSPYRGDAEMYVPRESIECL